MEKFLISALSNTNNTLSFKLLDDYAQIRYYCPL